MVDIEPVLGGEAEFKTYLSKVLSWDKSTLIACWRAAHKYKDPSGKVCPRPLLVRRSGLNNGEVLILHPDDVKGDLSKIKRHARHGWLRTPVPRGKYFVFWSVIQPQEEVGQFHKEDAQAMISEPKIESAAAITTLVKKPKKKKGRRNVRPNQSLPTAV